jgi:hypothetical protein
MPKAQQDHLGFGESKICRAPGALVEDVFVQQLVQPGDGDFEMVGNLLFRIHLERIRCVNHESLSKLSARCNLCNSYSLAVISVKLPEADADEAL